MNHPYVTIITNAGSSIILVYSVFTILHKKSQNRIQLKNKAFVMIVTYRWFKTCSQPDLMLHIIENEGYVIYAVQASITTKCPMDFSSYPFDMCASCHIGCVVIGVKYRNWHRTLMFIYFLLFCLGKFITNQITNLYLTNWPGHKLQKCKSVLIEFAPSK